LASRCKPVPNLALYVNYDGILPTGNITEQTVQAGLRWKF
jgi:hypothetical protein